MWKTILLFTISTTLLWTTSCQKKDKNIYELGKAVQKMALVNGPSYATMAALRDSTPIPKPGDSCNLLAYYATEDGGGGTFYWNAADISPDDGGVVIRSGKVPGTGRWNRVYNGAVSLKWFGMKTVEQGAVLEQGTRLNMILQKYRQVNFDLNGTINIDVEKTPVLVPDNSKITFSKDSCRLRVIPCDTSTYRCMQVWNVHDCEINNANIIGDRSDPAGTREGQFGMGIDIRSSSRITINDAVIKDCWGDGIYIGKIGATTNRDIRIVNAVCDNNGRQGISLITGAGVTIQNARLLRSNKHNPSGGLDIEPNDSNDTLTGIRVINAYTSGNAGRGINVTPVKMAGTTAAVDIRIEGHISEGDKLGFSAVGMSDKTIAGNIVYVNGKISQAGSNGISIRRYAKNMPLISIQGTQVINCNADTSTSPKYGAAVCIFRESNEPGPVIGAVEMINLKITDDRPAPLHASAIYVRDDVATDNTGPVVIKNPVSIGPISTKDISPVVFRSTGIIEDGNHVIVKDLANLTVTHNWTNFYSRYTNTGSTTLSTVNLAIPVGGYPDVEFVVTAAAFLRIKAESNSSISGLTTTGGYIQSNQPGAAITLRKTSATEWAVVKQTGTWTAGS